MNADVMSLFRELTDRSAAEREACSHSVRLLPRFAPRSSPCCDSTGCRDQARAVMSRFPQKVHCWGNTATRGPAWHSPLAST